MSVSLRFGLYFVAVGITASCNSYQYAGQTVLKDELNQPGVSNVRWLKDEDASPQLSERESTPESDISACVAHLSSKKGKPESVESARQEIIECMRHKGWHALQEIIVR